MSRNSFYYYVRPRYSPGSPALVDERTALGVARDEKLFYEHQLEGAYGEELQQEAHKLGLHGIVEKKREVKRGKFWEVYDMITGEVYLRPTSNNHSSQS